MLWMLWEGRRLNVTEKTHLIFETESGSSYEINEGYIRRLNMAREKRGDGKWFRLVQLPDLFFDTPVIIVMESLSIFGEDDHGNTESSDITVRTTTPVVNIIDLGDVEDHEPAPF